MRKIKICPYCESFCSNEIVCSDCARELKEVVNSRAGFLEFCDEFTAPFIYSGLVRQAIHRFKFKGFEEYCESFCYFMSSCTVKKSQIVVNVPSNNTTDKLDCSLIIARKMSKIFKLKFKKGAVRKIKQTKLQHNCTLIERVSNLKNSFEANPKKVAGKVVLICDDVITTGTTMNEIARACKKAGAFKVYGLAIALSKILFK